MRNLGHGQPFVSEWAVRWASRLAFSISISIFEGYLPDALFKRGEKPLPIFFLFSELQIEMFLGLGRI